MQLDDRAVQRVGARGAQPLEFLALQFPCALAQLVFGNDQLVGIDVLIVNPDKLIIAEYKLRQSAWELERKKLKRLRTARANTLDGTVIELHANIEKPEDIAEVKANGATGIGLFRSEFLFLNREHLPGEEEQFEAYRSAAAGMEGQPVTIRTFDLGGDKQLNGTKRVANNPALGLRAIRFCLAEPQLFRTQIRALLRATHYGNVKILIPMLSSVSELNQTLQFIAATKQSLDDEGIPYDREVKIGGYLDHSADLHLAVVRDAFVIQALLGRGDELQSLVEFGDTGQHRYQYLDVAIMGGAQQRAYLGAEQLRFSKAKTDRAQSQRGIIGDALGSVQLLVPAQIESAYGDGLAFHARRRRSIRLELLLLARQMFAVEEQEFAAEQADPGCAVFFHLGDICLLYDVGIQLDDRSVQRVGARGAQPLELFAL